MHHNVSLQDLQSQAAAEHMAIMLKGVTYKSGTHNGNGNTLVYGLAYLRPKLEEHHSDEGKCFNKLTLRLIGEQAMLPARHCYRLIDCLESVNETDAEKLKRLALSKIAEYLRDAGGLFNIIHLDSLGEIDQLDEFCKHYFNLLALFFTESNQCFGLDCGIWHTLSCSYNV